MIKLRLSLGVEWRNRCVSLHRCWVEKCWPRVCDWQPQTTGKTGTTKKREGNMDTHASLLVMSLVCMFPDLLWHHLRNGSKVFGGANGSRGERRGLLHREFQGQIQRYTLLLKCAIPFNQSFSGLYCFVCILIFILCVMKMDVQFLHCCWHLYRCGCTCKGEKWEDQFKSVQSPHTQKTFLSCLSGINVFLKETVKNCIKNGYVQTLMGRRRYLPGITNSNTHIKAHVSRRCPSELDRLHL